MMAMPNAVAMARSESRNERHSEQPALVAAGLDQVCGVTPPFNLTHTSQSLLKRVFYCPRFLAATRLTAVGVLRRKSGSALTICVPVTLMGMVIRKHDSTTVTGCHLKVGKWGNYVQEAETEEGCKERRAAGMDIHPRVAQSISPAAPRKSIYRCEPDWLASREWLSDTQAGFIRQIVNQ